MTGFQPSPYAHSHSHSPPSYIGSGSSAPASPLEFAPHSFELGTNQLNQQSHLGQTQQAQFNQQLMGGYDASLEEKYGFFS